MTAAKLRASILQLAIQGKLVPKQGEWETVRIEDLGDFCGGHTPSKANADFWGGDCLWVTSKDMKSKYITDTHMKLTRKGAEELELLPPDTVLMTTRSGILRRTFPVAIAKQACTINQDQKALRLKAGIIVEYVYLALRAFEPIILKDYVKSGTTVESVIWNKFINFEIPLPPLVEQRRIVEKVEELMPLVEQYGKAEEELSKLNKDFPAALKKSILQAAIQGKLVPKQGEWKTVKLGEIVTIKTGKRDANYGKNGGAYPFFTCAKDPIRCPSYSFSGESIILAGNGDIGNISYFNGEFEAYQRTYVLQSNDRSKFCYAYLLFHLQSNWVEYNRDKTYGSAIQYIRLSNIVNYPVRLPPLAEQKRIVEKVEELFSAIDDSQRHQ